MDEIGGAASVARGTRLIPAPLSPGFAVPPVIFRVILAWFLSGIVLAVLVPLLHARGGQLQQWRAWGVILAAFALCVGPDLGQPVCEPRVSTSRSNLGACNRTPIGTRRWCLRPHRQTLRATTQDQSRLAAGSCVFGPITGQFIPPVARLVAGMAIQAHRIRLGSSRMEANSSNPRSGTMCRQLRLSRRLSTAMAKTP